jgi:catechol 2,3-dioxygenase-like lactoylglutathione lyase family enzyme
MSPPDRMNVRSCLAFLLFGAVACKQDATVPAIQVTSSFVAIVTEDIDRSVNWYSSVFGLVVTSEVDNGSDRVTILNSDNLMLELLQLQGSINRSQALDLHPDGTQMQGHFKVGFKVQSMDSWLSHLASLQVEVPQVFTDAGTGKRNFLVQDPDGNLIQFFE